MRAPDFRVTVKPTVIAASVYGPTAAMSGWPASAIRRMSQSRNGVTRKPAGGVTTRPPGCARPAERRTAGGRRTGRFARAVRAGSRTRRRTSAARVSAGRAGAGSCGRGRWGSAAAVRDRHRAWGPPAGGRWAGLAESCGSFKKIDVHGRLQRRGLPAGGLLDEAALLAVAWSPEFVDHRQHRPADRVAGLDVDGPSEVGQEVFMVGIEPTTAVLERRALSDSVALHEPRDPLGAGAERGLFPLAGRVGAAPLPPQLLGADLVGQVLVADRVAVDFPVQP